MTPGPDVREKLLANAAVVALIGDRIYANVAPQGAAVPRVVFTVISNIPENSFTGTAETRITSARLQLDCYAKRYDAAHELADAVDLVVANLGLTDLSALREDARDLYENETQLYRVSIDYIVWS